MATKKSYFCSRKGQKGRIAMQISIVNRCIQVLLVGSTDSNILNHEDPKIGGEGEKHGFWYE